MWDNWMGLPAAKMSMVRVGVSYVGFHLVVRLVTASSRRFCGTELKNPTRSSLMACRVMCEGSKRRRITVVIAVEAARRVPKWDLKYEMMVRPFCQCFLAFRWTMP